MQGVILAAGTGKRLAPLTDHLPKCLIPIGKRPILAHQIQALRRSGVGDIFVVGGFRKEKVTDFLKSEKRTFFIENPRYQTSNILTSFWYALKAVKKADDLIVTAGDVIFKSSLTEGLVRRASGDVTLCVVQKPCGEEEVKVVTELDSVCRLGKNLDPSTAYGEFLGIFLVRCKILSFMEAMVDEMIQSNQVQGYLFDMLNRLIQSRFGSVKAYEVGKALCEDIDTPEDVEKISQRIEWEDSPSKLQGSL